MDLSEMAEADFVEFFEGLSPEEKKRFDGEVTAILYDREDCVRHGLDYNNPNFTQARRAYYLHVKSV